MKYGRSLQELAIELDRQAKVKKDYVATAGAMQMTAVNENFDLVIGNTPFQLNENAHRQLGLQLKIPAPYYERMRAENPGLLMANVNGWFQQNPELMAELEVRRAARKKLKGSVQNDENPDDRVRPHR